MKEVKDKICVEFRELKPKVLAIVIASTIEEVRQCEVENTLYYFHN